jgi:hypothetical protein
MPRDVLKLCVTERATLLDRYRELSWWAAHQDQYDWTDAATPNEIAEVARKTQTDLDTIASCASHAINHPGDAKMPADFASGIPAGTYPLSLPMPRGPKAKGQPPAPTPIQIPVPDLLGREFSEIQGDPPPQFWADLMTKFALNWVRGEGRTGNEGAGGVIYQQDPAPPAMVAQGSTLTLTIYDDAN